MRPEGICGSYISSKCSKCGANHVYKRFCKTAGCKIEGCAEARQRQQLRKMLCVNFDYEAKFFFITLTVRNCSAVEVNSKQFRQGRIAAIKSLFAALDCENYIVSHEITINEKLATAQRYHYHHHVVCQLEYDSDRDLTSHVRELWQDEIGMEINIEHGVSVMETNSCDHVALLKYICKYITKGSTKKKQYHPAGMQAFQRHGQLVERDFEYEFESYCLAKGHEIVRTALPSVVLSINHPRPKGKRVSYEMPDKTKSDYETMDLDGHTVKVHYLGSKEPVLLKRKVRIIIKQRISKYEVHKQCVNCDGWFREDKYSRDPGWVLMDARERDEYWDRLMLMAMVEGVVK